MSKGLFKMDQFWHYQKQVLYFGKTPASKILPGLKTPCYLYDSKLVTRRFKAFQAEAQKYFKQPLIAFAVKANPNTQLLATLSKAGCGSDVVSQGEIQAALKGGVRPDKIIFSGVGKTRKEIDWVLKHCPNLFSLNVESASEIIMIEEMARKHKKTLFLALRLNPEVMANTHKSIATGAGIHKFGIDLETAAQTLKLFKQSPWIKLKGLSMHIGSQLTDNEALVASIQKCSDFVLKQGTENFPDLKFFDVGGGLGIPYLPEQKILPLETYMRSLNQALLPLMKAFPKLQIAFEPGRFIVGPAGVLITRVIRTKFQRQERFVIVDGAMNDFMRPALYQAKHQILLIDEVNSTSANSQVSKAHVAGPVCESTDVFSSDAQLPELQEGDFLLFSDCGAYGRSMASTYNCRPLPKEYFL